MQEILGLIAVVMGFLGLSGMFLCMFFFIPIGTYFFARVLLKFMGLHSGTPEQFRKELKLIAMCGVLALFTIGCLGVMELIGWATGPHPHSF